MIDDQILAAGNYNFAKFGIIPAVVFLIDIPMEIFVVLKDSAYEPSSPLRHACELYGVLQSISFSVYSDGGPDHRHTHVSVQLSLICLFLKIDLDYLCAGRTAPYHS